MVMPVSPANLFKLQIYAAMQQFFNDAPQFNKAADFVFNRCA
jgi:hypothetical protein